MPSFARFAPYAGLVVLAACGQADADSTSATRPYRVGVADRGDIKVFVEETGLVEPERQIIVKSPISGVVQRLMVREGARVAPGQLLARIVPDMGARVGFLEEAKPAQADVKPGVLAPSAAIVQRGDRDVAFVVAGGKVAQRALKLGRTLGDDREVLDGLAGGEQVVLDPPDTLADGARVTLARDEAASDDANNE